MTQDDVIKITRALGICELTSKPKHAIHYSLTIHEMLDAFKLVATKERAKSLKLWMLLDDIDTADDIAKADDAIYRSLCRQAHKKRWDVLTGDDVDNAIKARG